MAKFQIDNFEDYKLNRIQQKVAAAVQELTAEMKTVIRSIQVKGNVTLTGNEDYVLVDAASAVSDIYILLPAPGTVSRAITVKVTKPGNRAVIVKASDTQGVRINEGNQLTVTDTVTIVATDTQFWTV